MNVKAWSEKVIIPTYEVGQPDKNPMFFEKRVYQGSSGVVYPNPVIEKIHDEKVDKEYNGVFLENEYVKIMILPELGGRVQMAYDKIKERHFVYYNQVVKPALVGLCGPWISGGIEFNWPQHHRPSTFEAVEHVIEENEDGSKTIWVNEVEKMFHTKGMAGFTLHPNKAYLEIKAKLSNLTSTPQTFLWWANPAVVVHDDYQSVFPPDVNAVFDHGKRDVSSFPIATGTYYKVDYSPGTDISNYKNIPVPTSYMAVNSKYNFLGGYEHNIEAGMLHVADHHVSPGKKQWTWGNGDFGVAWDRNLTDEDGPYIELMAGVFTDNQPDFTWLKPFEEKTFTQYFLPYRELGVVKNASKDVLMSIDKNDDKICLKIFVTSKQELKINLLKGEDVCFCEHIELSPEGVFEKEIQFSESVDLKDFKVFILNKDAKQILKYDPADNENSEPLPEPAKPALLPNEIETSEELFLTGQHLEQYRHATYRPMPYYLEAIKRNPTDIRNNNAAGLWYFKKGLFDESVPYFKKAIETIISRNPNPYNCEPYYNLGLAQFFLSNIDEAYNAFFKASWDNAYQDAAYYYIAQIDYLRGDFEICLEHINWAIDRNARNGKAYIIKANALKQLGFLKESQSVLSEALTRDCFNLTAKFEQYLSVKESGKDSEAKKLKQQLFNLSRGTAHNAIEYAIDYIGLGLYQRAIDFIQIVTDNNLSDPLINYYIAYAYLKLENEQLATQHLKIASKADSSYCFPNRLQDILILKSAIKNNSNDAKALYYLGNLYYDKQQYNLAISLWEKSANIDSEFATVHRNLGLAFYNKKQDEIKSKNHYEKAFSLNNEDARVLMELDSLYKKLNRGLEGRLEFLNKHFKIAEQRDDLFLEIVSIYNALGKYDEAYKLLMSRQFHPWEGGEGKVSGQYIYALVELAKKDIFNSNFENAIELLEKAQIYPDNLGEGKLPGEQENDIFYWLGCAYQGLGDKEKTKLFWQKATVGLDEPGIALFYNDQQPGKIFYQGCAWSKLNHPEKANAIFKRLIAYGEKNMNNKIRLDYFAVSLPDLLIFETDLNANNKLHCLYIAGLGYMGICETEEAKQIFNQILDIENMNFGAASHLNLIESLSNTNSKLVH
jgi:tetratricopeptide (TPR) repeat protein